MIPTQLSTAIMNMIGRQTTFQLAEFASSMIYLMWHARRKPLLVGNDFLWQPLYSHYNTASPAFKKFCHQVLAATQLRESAVYLSLKYIAILLKSNPSIEGAEGSEYRLFIVALMLANKFLDDNTFTNKTWSDVSGMNVYDLNVMEAEFLEALDYNLFVHEHEFNIWKQLLEECRNRMMYYHSNPQQVIISTLQTLGLYQSNNDAVRLQLENAYKRYQQFHHQQQPPTTKSWDPLTYQSSYSFYQQPISSWGNN